MRYDWRSLLVLKRAMVVIAVLTVIISLVRVAPDVGHYSPRSLMVSGAFLLAITIGETWRVSLLDTREIAPMGLAAALALTMSAELPVDQLGHDHVGHDAAFVVIVTSMGSLAGSVLHHAVTGQPVLGSVLAMRVITIAVAASLYRAVPFVDGRTLLELDEAWEDARWKTAIAMFLVATAAMLVRSLLQGIRSAWEDHAPLWRSLLDEVRALAALTVALAATATITALSVRSLGPVAIPLFLSPLILLQTALRRQSVIRATNRQTIRALSRLTEQGGYTGAGHSARVAMIAVAIGRDMGMSERDLLDLEYAALLHDIGQVTLDRPIPGGATVEAAPADQRMISNNGAAILARTVDLARLSEILAEQSTPYRQVREFDQDLPLSSRIIKVANAFEDLTVGRRTAHSTGLAVERIQLGLGYEYDPYVVESLVRVLRRQQPSAVPV